MIIEIIKHDTTYTTIEADDWNWYYDTFMVFGATFMDFFDTNDISSITIDGEIIYESTGSDVTISET